jgi:excisionase family DNA binding protein
VELNGSIGGGKGMETKVEQSKLGATDELLTVDELIRWLRLGRTRTNDLLRRGSIRSYKIGRRRLVRRQDVMQFLDEQEYHPGQEQQ